MKIRNIYLALKDQLPFRRLVRNIWKGHVFGLLSKRSHENANGKAKISYGSKQSATKAAADFAVDLAELRRVATEILM